MRFVKTKTFPPIVLSQIPKCIFTVAIGASNGPLATIIRNSGAGPSISFVRGAIKRVLNKLAPGLAHDKAPVSMSPSIFNSITPMEIAFGIAFYGNYLMAKLLIVEENL